MKNKYSKYFKTDLISGFVVFLIALPLCLGISMASGAPLFSGIIAGIVGGIIVGFTSNSNINVSGPAASVALVIFTGIQSMGGMDNGGFQAILVAVIVAGIFQLILGFLKAGTVAYFFPNAMIKGILASIGLILILKQIPHAFGVDSVFEGVESFWNNDGENTFSEIARIWGHVHWGAVIITLISMLIILIWERPVLKNFLFFKYFPSALAAVLIGIGLNLLFSKLEGSMVLTNEHLVVLPVASTFGDFLGFFAFPDFSYFLNPKIYGIALSIAFIASLESLLSTEAGDKLDPMKRRTSTNRELKAQGLGNIVAGLIGGLPITAVIVRTSANVDAGGRTKVSTITHGTVMLLAVAFIPLVLNMIPLASLAAVLFVVGFKLTAPSVYREVYKQGFKQFLPFIATILIVIFTDLINGIMVGGALAVFFILRDNYKNAYLHDKVIRDDDKHIKIKLAQETTFLNKADILLFLDKIPENMKVTIDGSEAKFIHPDIYDIIDDFVEGAQHKNIEVELIDLSERNKTVSFWTNSQD